jgi:hypothetical protein
MECYKQAIIGVVYLTVDDMISVAIAAVGTAELFILLP